MVWANITRLRHYAVISCEWQSDRRRRRRRRRRHRSSPKMCVRFRKAAQDVLERVRIGVKFYDIARARGWCHK